MIGQDKHEIDLMRGRYHNALTKLAKKQGRILQLEALVEDQHQSINNMSAELGKLKRKMKRVET